MTGWLRALALTCVLLAGCGTVAAEQVAPTNRAEASIEAIMLPRGAGRSSQAIVKALTDSAVDHFACALYRIHDGTASIVARQDTPVGAGIARTVDWTHLLAHTRYEIAVWACDASGRILDEGGAPATADVTTGLDDQRAVALPVQLANVVFDGHVHFVLSAASKATRRADHLHFTLEEGSGRHGIRIASGDTPDGSGLSRTVDFWHLERNTSYCAIAEARSATGRVLARRKVAFSIGSDDRVEVAIAL